MRALTTTNNNNTNTNTCCSPPGNPEEGELRPQLLDRFGMHAQIGTVKEPELRVRIVAERSTFDEDPASEWTRQRQHREGRSGSSGSSRAGMGGAYCCSGSGGTVLRWNGL